MKSILLLVLFYYINHTSQKCGNFSPRVPSQCHYYSTDYSNCCYISRNEKSTKYYSCYPIPIHRYVDIVDKGYLELGNFNYTSIDCGYTPGMSCSQKTPSIDKDCFSNSLTNNNCCLVITPNGNKRCIFSGNSLVSDFKTENNFRIICFKKYYYGWIGFWALILLAIFL